MAIIFVCAMLLVVGNVSGKAGVRGPVPIGELARKLGVAISTLRYWEERGLLVGSLRRGGKRWYDADAQHRAAILLLFQRKGMMSIAELKEMFDSAGVDWRDTVEKRIAQLDHELARIREAREYLAHAIQCPEADPMRDCAVMRAYSDDLLGG